MLLTAVIIKYKNLKFVKVKAFGFGGKSKLAKPHRFARKSHLLEL